MPPPTAPTPNRTALLVLPPGGASPTWRPSGRHRIEKSPSTADEFTSNSVSNRHPPRACIERVDPSRHDSRHPNLLRFSVAEKDTAIGVSRACEPLYRFQ
ncbi:Hypothetical protein NTJ_06708 [Nesidiocoris tenuis]|uniref:Uncharacterized protein n=1 Tax=Nesidiocoris tenuis TaxID=355587 RepID=A0ABN7APK7_9HEMI|nr:Hypothetical protein NTJ_06708 [Nesidiocoris tenuis]